MTLLLVLMSQERRMKEDMDHEEKIKLPAAYCRESSIRSYFEYVRSMQRMWAKAFPVSVLIRTASSA